MEEKYTLGSYKKVTRSSTAFEKFWWLKAIITNTTKKKTSGRGKSYFLYICKLFRKIDDNNYFKTTPKFHSLKFKDNHSKTRTIQHMLNRDQPTWFSTNDESLAIFIPSYVADRGLRTRKRNVEDKRLRNF